MGAQEALAGLLISAVLGGLGAMLAFDHRGAAGWLAGAVFGHGARDSELRVAWFVARGAGVFFLLGGVLLLLGMVNRALGSLL